MSRRANRGKLRARPEPWGSDAIQALLKDLHRQKQRQGPRRVRIEEPNSAPGASHVHPGADSSSGRASEQGARS